MGATAVAAGAAATTVAAAAAGRRHASFAGQQGRSMLGGCRASLAMPRRVGPTPVWDKAGPAGAFAGPTSGVERALEPGRLHRVVWVCWTGNNAMPPHLRLCLETIRRNAGIPVVLLTPRNLAAYVPDPHPAYPYLHLAHRADYLRCYLLHHYGGIYLDADTVCLRSLEGLFEELGDDDVAQAQEAGVDAVGYDGTPWGEYIGISCMGPFRPQSDITTMWFNSLHGTLQRHLPEVVTQKTDVFYWQEILRDIVLPISLAYRSRISKALLALNPSQEQLWSTEPYEDVLDAGVLQDKHILILNNANYGSALSHLSADAILDGPAVLSQLLRRALAVDGDAARGDVLAAVAQPLS